MSATPLKVPCPSCRKPALYGPTNPWRPFCSARCRNVDLGAWASEQFRMPADAPPDDDSSGSASDHPYKPGA